MRSEGQAMFSEKKTATYSLEGVRGAQRPWKWHSGVQKALRSRRSLDRCLSLIVWVTC